MENYAVAPLSLDTRVPTREGIKKLKELKAGDYVFSPNGNQCRVNYLSPIVKKDTYEIIFDGGEKIISTDNHLWTLEVLSSNGAGKSLAWKNKTVTTKDIFSRVKYNKRNANRIRCAEPLKFEKKDLCIDPYVLGAWLGDGRNNRGLICGHFEDIEIRQQIEKRGYKLSYTRQQKNTVYFTVLGLRTTLRQLNLLNNKHIPQQYFTASIEQRMDLLRGLMDTDGMCSKNGE